ncbi:hypothetical protein EDD90_2824 [Streptomyces sp. Ag109_O5-1]|uniref:hypothetical protein n=1 Tax=Streptomyces sp. Ag109_O5-1 TaxID=1938851 RepID=UPI000FAAAC13|nr:hypothetical protein [Streptomyces sp. Ag109_O5-1]RPE39806.1 hypothetical protein EDD90_2824 [Streptomyces sp. Ag109_O5-1]
MPRTAPPPTTDQLLNLIARAERKGGLSADEGDRLRAGLLRLAHHQDDGPDEPIELVDLRRKYSNLRKTAWRWKRKALAVAVDPARPDAPPVPAPVDTEARDALRRVTALAHRWTYIPAKRQAGASVLAAITNRDTDEEHGPHQEPAGYQVEGRLSPVGKGTPHNG